MPAEKGPVSRRDEAASRPSPIERLTNGWRPSQRDAAAALLPAVFACRRAVGAWCGVRGRCTNARITLPTSSLCARPLSSGATGWPLTAHRAGSRTDSAGSRWNARCFEFVRGSRARNQRHTGAEDEAGSRIGTMAAPTKNTGIEWALLALLLLLVGLIVYSMR